MNFLHIINEISDSDPEFLNRIDTRRSAMRGFLGMSKKITMATLPVFAGTLFQKAYGRTNDTVVEILNYALTLEHLEAGFYQKANEAADSLIPGEAAKGAIKTIGDHETAHVKLLEDVIRSMSGTPIAAPVFDFTAGGIFNDVFSNYVTFLAVAQAFEDTGVRAYKGRAGELVKGGDLLEAALNIHSVEARHAAHIRYMRRNANHAADIKPWITGKDSGIGAVVQPVYDGEDNSKQAGIEITTINGLVISKDAATEAFDEPLTKEQVLAIVGPFIVS